MEQQRNFQGKFRSKNFFQEKNQRKNIGEQKLFFKENLGEREPSMKKLYEINFKKSREKIQKRKNVYIKNKKSQIKK